MGRVAPPGTVRLWHRDRRTADARESRTTSTQDQPTGSDIFVSVEMSRSKWVVGIHTPLADKIALHTMACGDVEALLALIDRAGAKLAASGSNSPAVMVCYEAGYEGFWLYRRLIALGIRVW
jgi:transposase